MLLTSHDLKNRDCLYKKLKKNKMKFNLFFVLLSIFAIIVLTHPSAGSSCHFPCCRDSDDCVSAYPNCNPDVPCVYNPDCGTCWT